MTNESESAQTGRIDPDQIECKSRPGSLDGDLACHHRRCGYPHVELVDHVPDDEVGGHPSDIVEVYQCPSCRGRGRFVIEHFHRDSSGENLGYRMKYSGVLTGETDDTTLGHLPSNDNQLTLEQEILRAE